MNMWMMYLVLKLDDLVWGAQIFCTVCFTITVICLIVFIISSIVGADSDCQEGVTHIKKAFIPMLKIFIPAAVVSFLLFVAIPTTKQAAAIYFVPKVLNNKQIQKMPNKLVTLANDWMDEQIKSIKTK